jgi:hypothetical protein
MREEMPSNNIIASSGFCVGKRYREKISPNPVRSSHKCEMFLYRKVTSNGANPSFSKRGDPQESLKNLFFFFSIIDSVSLPSHRLIGHDTFLISLSSPFDRRYLIRAL